jgi:NADH:ubiquinone oxidoreductase subunit C
LGLISFLFLFLLILFMLTLSLFFPRFSFITCKYSNFVGLVFGAPSSLLLNFDEFLFVLSFIKKSSLFRLDYFVDAYALDFPIRSIRFELHYRLASSFYFTSLHFMRFCHFENSFSSTASLTFMFSGANWFEREIWDIFGIFFFDHPDLRRILTDYGFDGFPLRKDFPISGYSQVRFDELARKVVYEPVEFSQEFRNFDFLNPWIR